VRSRITDCAALVSFQRFGSSARAFSAASFSSTAAGSKTPPQQGERLLDLADDGLDLGFHRRIPYCGRANDAAAGASDGAKPSRSQGRALIGLNSPRDLALGTAPEHR